MPRQSPLTCVDDGRTGWPTSANPHLIVHQITAIELGPISQYRVAASTRGQQAGPCCLTTVKRLRAERPREDGLADGPDPLPLAVVVDLDLTTAMPYASSARPLLDTEVERDTSGRADTPGRARVLGGSDPRVPGERLSIALNSREPRARLH